MNQNRITRVTVKNYRSLADVTVDLGPLTVLVGLNGSGKSNFIDVLRFVSEALREGLELAIQRRGGIDRIRRWSAEDVVHDVTIGLEFVLPDGAKADYTLTIAGEVGSDPLVKHERYMEDNKPFFEIEAGEWIYQPFEGVGIDLGRTGLALYTFAKLFPMGWAPRLYNFLEAWSFYTLFPEELRKPQSSEKPYPLDGDGQNFASALRRFLDGSKWADDLRYQLAQIVPGVSDVQVLQVGSYLVVQLQHEYGGAFELDMESDGTARVLGLLLALYQELPRALLTIEEPELTIHPNEMKRLCEVIEEASLRSQIILTTHSPDLIASFDADSLRVVERDEDGNTRIGPLDEVQIGVIEDQLFKSSDLLRVQGLRRASATP